MRRVPDKIVLLALLVWSSAGAIAQTSNVSPKTAEELFLAGYALDRAGKCDEALEQYAAALRLDANHFGARVNSGGCYLSQRKFEKAATEFKAAAKLRPDDAFVQFNLGLADGALGQRPAAINAFKEAIRLKPDLHQAYAPLAALYGDQRDYDSGIKLLIQATQFWENDAGLFYELGNLHLANGATPSAIVALQRAIALDGKFTAARLSLGAAYESSGRLPEAADIFREALTNDSANPTVHVRLGVILEKMGEHQNAIREFQTAIDYKKDYAAAYQDLAWAYKGLGEQQKALAALKEAARLAPNDERIIYELAHAYLDVNDYEAALEPLRKVTIMNPADIESQFVLGNTYMIAGRYDDAITTLNKVLELKPDHEFARERLRISTERKNLEPKFAKWKQAATENPNDAQARAQLGWGYYALGRFAEAEVEYLRAVSLDANNPDIYNMMGVNYSESGKHEKAVEAYKKSSELRPHQTVFLSLGNTYQRLGRLDEAIAAYKKSLEIKPTFTHAIYQLGQVYATQGHHQDALAMFRKVVELEPRDVYANYSLGLMYAVTGDKTGAMQQYNVLKTLNPDVAANLLRTFNSNFK